MNKKILAAVVCVLVVVLVIGVFQWKSTNWGTPEAQNAFEDAALTEANIDGYTAAIVDQIGTDGGEEENQTGKTTVSTTYPPRTVDGLLVLGASDAPVTITEFSSLSCPHCASFHADTLPSIKTDYIDTGKVQFVFMDFPLNQQALHGTLLLKCVEATQRYELMELLFKQQSQWAFEGDHQTKLKQYASLLGLSSEKADACMSDVDVEKQLLMRMKAASTQYNISSTPTFLIQPGNKIVTGSATYGTFSTEIEKILKK
jgi:protein-disulfide isomerase